MSELPPSDTLTMADNRKLKTLAEAQARALEVASVLIESGEGRFTRWLNETTLCVFNPDKSPLATIHVESLQ